MAESLAANLDAVDRAIARLGPPPAPSVRQAVLARRAELRALHAQGHSYEEIAAALTAEGLPIKASTLRVYLCGDSTPSRAGRTAARAAVAHRNSKASSTASQDRASPRAADDLDLGDLITEATANGRPVRAARVR